MRVKPIRVYVENSVLGGYYDEIFKEHTKKLFELFIDGTYKPVISDHVLFELNNGAPQEVIDVLRLITYEYHETNEEMEFLANLYISEGVVTEKYKNDALHVAIATVLGVDLLVSWNCTHIVNYDRLRKVNNINYREGYNF